MSLRSIPHHKRVVLMTTLNTHQRRRRLWNKDVGQDDRFNEFDMYGLYRSPRHGSSFLVNQIDNAGEVMLATRQKPKYAERGHEIEETGKTTLDAFWIGSSLRTTQARNIDTDTISHRLIIALRDPDGDLVQYDDILYVEEVVSTCHGRPPEVSKRS